MTTPTITTAPDFIRRYLALGVAEYSPERETLGQCWCLVFPVAGVDRVEVCHGTLCATHERAETLLSDRIANGEAFDHERPMLVWAAAARMARDLAVAS